MVNGWTIFRINCLCHEFKVMSTKPAFGYIKICLFWAEFRIPANFKFEYPIIIWSSSTLRNLKLDSLTLTRMIEFTDILVALYSFAYVTKVHRKSRRSCVFFYHNSDSRSESNLHLKLKVSILFQSIGVSCSVLYYYLKHIDFEFCYIS